MASTINADNGVVSGSSGVKTTADTSGVLALQSNGTTGLTLNTSLALGVGSGNSTGSSGQVLTSAGSGAAPAWATINTSPSVTATASGSISAGAPAILDSSGQATTITNTAITTATFQSASFPGAGQSGCTAYDSKRNRFYLLWNSTTALNISIYTVSIEASGVSLSLLSTSVVSTSNFAVNTGLTVCTYNATADKVVYLVQTAVYDSYCYVGVCTDTGVNFGAGTNFSTWNTLRDLISIPGTSTCMLASTKYPNGGVTSGVINISGTTPTISGVNIETNVNFDYGDLEYDSGSGYVYLLMGKTDSSNWIYVLNTSGALQATFTNPLGATNVLKPRLVYSATSNKTIFTYQGTTNYPTAVIGTYSGGAWTFGTPVVINATGYTGFIDPQIASDNRFLVYYSTSFKIGTISGTSISFGSASSTGMTVPPQWMFAYSSASNFTFNADYQNSKVVFAPLSTTTLTSTNFLGFSSASYTNGQTATINTVGSVNTSQSGLTPGLKYFVTTSGTLSTTNTGVYAGLATSASNILVKG